MPTVSVIIPTYNRASMLKGAIQSVLDQTYSDFEIIVVDDGSTDNTREVVNAFSDKRIKYIFQENHGRSNARNHGISLAQGKYIAFLDSDDLFLPTKLEKQVACLERKLEFGMVYSSAICIDEHGERMPFSYKATVSGWIYRKVAFYVPVTILLPTVMIRAEALDVIGVFDETMERFEDIDMWRRVARCYPILAIPELLCKVRTHPGNELANQDPEVVLGALTYYIKKAFVEDCDESVVFRRRGAAAFHLRYGESVTWPPLWHEAGRDFLLNSIKYWPFQKFAYVLLIAWNLNKPTPKFTLPLRRGLLVILIAILAPLYTTRAIWHRIRNWLIHRKVL